ncbi:MAG TPA: hypothetical protein VLC93_02800, partial [Myxococcota bacterium]|nr:hypothetical protein [Myxococcota bacterium]
MEHLVFDLGTPCSAEGDCASGFCVDGVCCDSACGGGVRDLLSCSSVYGAVNGLVDGSCTTLRRGDPCGVVIAAEPCLWLGSRVNGGGHCTPPSETVGSACFPCVNAADCGGAFPVCVDGACGGCDGNFGDGTSAACPVASPVCNNGQCGGCGDCAGLAPACDGLTGMCSPCNGDYGSDATLPCPRGESPACLGNGACASCSATNTTACEGATPACDTATSSCASCNGDYGSAATRACADLDAPLCLAGGGCGRCNTSADCNGGDVCLPALGTCGPPCASDAQCATGAWCAVGVCTPKLPNGSALPAAALGAGTCVDKHAARACLSGTC